MPFLTVNTNATMNDSDVFVEEAARFVAAELHKPVNYVIVTLNVNAKMSFGGSTNTAALWLNCVPSGWETWAIWRRS